MRLVHRVHTPAPPAVVWDLLGHPARWPTFHPGVRRMHGVRNGAAAGQHLLAVARGVPLRIPVDVLDAERERRLAVRIHSAPGLREEFTSELTASLRGGTDITVSTVVDGAFARVAVVPVWMVAEITTRLLGWRAGRAAREVQRNGPRSGVA